VEGTATEWLMIKSAPEKVLTEKDKKFIQDAEQTDRGTWDAL